LAGGLLVAEGFFDGFAVALATAGLADGVAADSGSADAAPPTMPRAAGGSLGAGLPLCPPSHEPATRAAITAAIPIATFRRPPPLGADPTGTGAPGAAVGDGRPPAREVDV
jgi:hypothetical protein